MTECKFVASRKVDADVKKHSTSLMRAATKHGARVARRKIEGDDFKAGVVSPEVSLDAFVADLRSKGWTVKLATPRPEPQKQEEQAEPGERTPHPLISETREAKLGCPWGSAEMKSIAHSMGITTNTLSTLACSAGRAFGHFRFNPFRLAMHLGTNINLFQDPQPRTDKLLKLMVEKYGEECEAVKFFRLQSVGFRPELLKTKTKNHQQKGEVKNENVQKF